MSNVVDIRQIKKDADDTKVVAVYNPLQEDFTHKFDGVEQTIPSGKHELFPENIARHLAGHLAKRIVGQIAEQERQEESEGVEGSKSKITILMKPYKQYGKRCEQLAKALVSKPEEKETPTSEELMEIAKEKKAKKEQKKATLISKKKDTSKTDKK